MALVAATARVDATACARGDRACLLPVRYSLGCLVQEPPEVGSPNRTQGDSDDETSAKVESDTMHRLVASRPLDSHAPPEDHGGSSAVASIKLPQT